MALSIILCILFFIIAIIIRFSILQNRMSQMSASWTSFALAVIATTICTLITQEQQGTLITGFATMLLCYSVLCKL
ncbi:MAG: hypothetical protein ACI4SM_05220 [Candidatus Gastranaerophilaceae bacterium]